MRAHPDGHLPSSERVSNPLSPCDGTSGRIMCDVLPPRDPRHEVHGLPSHILRRASTLEQPPLSEAALQAIRAAVTRVELFSRFAGAEQAPDHLDEACKAFREEHFDADTTVYNAGAAATTFYIVGSGEFSGSPDPFGFGDGVGVPWATRRAYPPGASFGDEALLGGGGCERDECVTCVTAGTVYSLDAAVFRSLLADQPGGGLHQRRVSSGAMLAADAPPSRLGAISMRDLIAEGWLGDGAFGVVWRVRHAPSGQLFALKCMERARLRRPQDADGVLRERHILGRLASAAHAHPLIVRAWRFYQDAHGLFMLLEHLGGGDLKATLARRTTLPPGRAAYLAACTACALNHLHAQHILYRDLKPENLVLDEHGVPRLIDFGLSKVLSAPDGMTIDDAFKFFGLSDKCTPRPLNSLFIG